ncbi:MAG: radical SAM family heme chaperone HemW [Enterovibrio sp.]
MILTPPLSLYVHIPWCIQKCPYCDFNSHAQKGPLAQEEYIEALLFDLATDLARFPWLKTRTLHSIFIGGGTPSLFSPHNIGKLLAGIRQQIAFADNIEITMEANPGAVEAGALSDYRQAGVNRLSIGVQSFDDQKLSKLGRIHNQHDAQNSALEAHAAGFTRLNLDLMHGLPEQTTAQALHDLKQAIALNPTHLSWYQLTIEPNTRFFAAPPPLPSDDTLWEIFEQGAALLQEAGFVQYETSAFCKPGFECQHNLNYWRFGDYLGIGCGAHGKITQEQITRTVKTSQPTRYLAAIVARQTQNWRSEQVVASKELPFEFFMNRFRLFEPCPKTQFSALTGVPNSAIAEPLARAVANGWLNEGADFWQVTAKGRLFLNDLLSEFLTEEL